MSAQSLEDMVKDFCPNFIQPFLENIDRRSCNDGNRELIPVFHKPHRKGLPPPSAVALTLKNLVGLPSKTASGGWFGSISNSPVNSLNTGQHIVVVPTVSLFVGNVMNASY